MGTYLLDQYTLLHMATGVIAYFFRLSLPSWILIHIVFEYIENTKEGMYMINTYLKIWPGGKPKADTFINCVGDTIAAILGWILAYSIETIGKKRNYF